MMILICRETNPLQHAQQLQLSFLWHLAFLGEVRQSSFSPLFLDWNIKLYIKKFVWHRWTILIIWFHAVPVYPRLDRTLINGWVSQAKKGFAIKWPWADFGDFANISSTVVIMGLEYFNLQLVIVYYPSLCGSIYI